MNKRHYLYLLALTICFIFALGDVSALFAQESASDEFTLEEITVTAQKRSENQQKVPIAMETITAETIKELGKTDIDQILSTISSVIINKAQDGMRVTLRGMSNDNGVFQGRQVSTPTVAVNMDGSYTNRSAAGDNLFDIERVEVLIGPQSTMYSTASPGGVVNVVTANPKLEKYEVTGIVEAGNYNLRHYEAVVNVPLASQFAFRVAGNYTKRDGYLTNGADDEDTQTVRLKALWQATEKLSFTLIGELSKIGGMGMGSNGVALFDDQDDVDNPWTAAAGRGQQVAGPQSMNDGNNYKYAGRMDWDLGIGTLVLLPSYTPRDGESTDIGTDMMTQEATYTNNKNEGSEKSVEARMTSSTDFTLFKWIFGANYYKSHDERLSETFFTDDNTANGYNYGYQDQTSKAVFGNITVPVTDRFRTTGGLRYTDEQTHSYMYESGRGSGPEEVDMPYSAPDYKLGIEYDLAENSMLYSDYSTSYRTQGMGTTADGEPFPAEKLKALTLGAKNRFWGNRMQLNASTYFYQYKNYMAVTGIGSVVDNYDPENPTVPISAVNGVINGNGHLDYVDNNENGVFDWYTDTLLDGMPSAGGQAGPGGPGANGASMDPAGKTTGDMKVYGIDISTSTLVTQNFKVDLGVSYLRKYFTDLVFDINQVTQELWNIPAVDMSGSDATFAPMWTVNAVFTYNINLGNGGTLSPVFDTRFQSEYKLYFLDTILQTDRVGGEIVPIVIPVETAAVQEPYHISNFSMVYTNPSGKWTLTGYVKNIEDYAVKRSIFSAGPSLGELTIGPPRTYGGILSVRF
jgi:iron complex outermembrane recepter protein